MQLKNEYCIKGTRPVLYSEPMNNTDLIVAQLNKLADKHRLNVAELARMAGLSQPTAHRILSGQSKNPKLENIRALAEALGTTIPELMGGNPALNTNAGPLGKSVPLYTIDQLSVGEETDARTPCPFHCGPNTYAFTVEGMAGMASAMHPMYGRAYPVGSIVFVDPDQANKVQHNDVVAAILTDDDAFTFRVLLREAGRDTLMPLNPQFPNIDPSRPFKIVGKVIGAILQ